MSEYLAKMDCGHVVDLYDVPRVGDNNRRKCPACGMDALVAVVAKNMTPCPTCNGAHVPFAWHENEAVVKLWERISKGIRTLYG